MVMDKLIELLTGADSSSGLLMVLGFLVIFLLLCIAYQYFGFKKAWEETLSSLIDDIDSLGVEIVDNMIAIARFPDDDEGYALGCIHTRALAKKRSLIFHEELLVIIQEIKVAYNGKNLNGAYTSAKSVLADVEILLKKYTSCKRSYQSFRQLSIDVDGVGRRLIACSNALASVRARLYPPEENLEKDTKNNEG